MSSGPTIAVVARRVFVAAGGGGDVIAATMLAARDLEDDSVVVATFSWDRLIVDPLPGPRSVDDFVDLASPAAGVHRVMSSTTCRPPAGSTLPRLAGSLPAQLFLLDASTGAVGLGRQIADLANHVKADELTVVDVGGDIVARGDEPGLRSPLADMLALAGCVHSGLPTAVVVCGPGLDGELDEAEVIARCSVLGARQRTALTADQVERFRPILKWHRSEATGLMILAVAGARGTVEVRDAGIVVPLTERSTAVFALEATRVAAGSLLFGPLATSRSLTEANERLRRLRGSTELDYERAKAARIMDDAVSGDSEAILVSVDRLTEQARERGVDYLTLRRLTELLGLRGTMVEQLSSLLQTRRSDRYNPPLWRVTQ